MFILSIYMLMFGKDFVIVFLTGSDFATIAGID